MKYYYITNPCTGEKKRVWIKRDEFEDGCLYLELWCNEGLHSVVTINLPDYHLDKNEAFVDTNDNPGLDDWLWRRGIARPTIVRGFSNYCSYPMMRFDISKI